MILKRFKEKSIKKKIDLMLSTRSVSVNDSELVSLGVILNADEFDNFEKFRSLATVINVRPNKLKVIAFTSNIKDPPNSWDTFFNPKDFDWRGKIKNIELQSFLDKKFDALISYYCHDVLELKLITAMSNAQLKIGILQSDQRLNDLIFETKTKEFDVFQKELKKYLGIFNKIKK